MLRYESGTLILTYICRTLFIAECRVGSLSVKGEGSNKKEARKKAASLMFARLSNGGLEEVSFLYSFPGVYCSGNFISFIG